MGFKMTRSQLLAERIQDLRKKEAGCAELCEFIVHGEKDYIDNSVDMAFGELAFLSEQIGELTDELLRLEDNAPIPDGFGGLARHCW